MKANKISEIKKLFINQKRSWKTFLWVFLYALLPSLWLMFRVYVINNINKASFNTYIQWEYINIFLEIIQQTMIFSLFWWFGKIEVNKKSHMNKVKEVYLLVLTIYTFVILLTSLFIGDLVKVLDSNEGYKQKTFFLMQLWSNVPSILSQVSVVIFLNLRMYRSFAILLLLKLTLSIMFDFTFANGSVFKNSYIGIGLSTILSETLIFLASFIMVIYQFGFEKFFKSKNGVQKYKFKSILFF